MKRTLPLTTLIFLIMLIWTSASGQSRITPAHDILHANEYRVAVGQNSMNFWDYADAVSQVPYNGINTPSTIFASALWFSGMDENGSQYVNWEDYNQHNPHYQPGTIPTMGQTPTLAEARAWNKVFSVRGNDILAHIEDAQDGTVDFKNEDIFGWPAVGNTHFESIHGFVPTYSAEGGAAFIEAEGSKNGIYEPELGEYPHVEGLSPDVIPGQITWAVFNNASFQERIYGLTENMMLEVQQTSYAFDCGNDLTDQTIFHNYKVISRSSTSFPEFQLALWMDPDLGCYTDDFIGCNPDQNTFYIYNSDNEDDLNCANRVLGYGTNPPVQTVTFLNSELDYFHYYNNSAIAQHPPSQTDPEVRQEFIHYMNGRWRDGSRITRGGTGYDPTSVEYVDHVFPDNPNDPTGWSMVTSNLFIGDRRIIATTNNTLESGSSVTYTIGFTYHRSPGEDHLENVNYALERVDELQSIYDSQLLGCVPEYCSCDCVWPGDANSDGMVDYLDAVNIIYAMGDRGDIRENGLVFQPKDVQNWSESSFRDINAKYADVNGDGVTDSSDLKLWSLYFGESNFCLEERGEHCVEGEDVYMEFNRFNDKFNGRLDLLKIFIKDPKPFLGLSYRLKYDGDLIELLDGGGTPRWGFGTSPYSFFHHDISSTGLSEYQLVSFNNSNINQAITSNQLEHIPLVKSDPPSTYPTDSVELKLCDFTIYYEDGSYERLPTMTKKLALPDSVVVTSIRTEKPLKEIEVFPNPSEGLFILNTNHSAVTTQVYDNHGVLVKTVRGKKVDLEGLGAGVYYFKVHSLEKWLGYSTVIKH